MAKFKVGDKVKFTEDFVSYTKGDVVEVIYLINDNHIRFKGKHGKGNCYTSRIQKITSKNQRITALEKEVAELRSLKELIPMLEQRVEQLGEIVEQLRKPSTVVEEVSAPYEYKTYKPNIGDIVVITGNTSASRNKVGDIGKVTHFNGYAYRVDVPQRPETADSNDCWTKPAEMRKATLVERELYNQSIKEKSADERLTVGDTAKVVKNKSKHNAEIGDIVKIKSDERDKQPYFCEFLNGESAGWFLESELERFKDEPIEKTANEQRGELIKKAKVFLEINKNKYGCYPVDNKYECKVEFIVNEKKRTVVALMRGYVTNKVYGRGIAKCMPTDVFNTDIGKAIALGRALGLDVSEFENAVQPSDVATGQTIIFKEVPSDLYRVDKRNGDLFNFTDLRTNEHFYELEYCDIEKWVTIINDTNAQY